MVQIEVRNERPNPMPFTVYFGGQTRGDAVQPPSVPAGPSRTAVTFYLPLADDWEIAMGGETLGGITGQGFDPTFRRECPLVIEHPGDGRLGDLGAAALPSFSVPADAARAGVPPRRHFSRRIDAVIQRRYY